VPESRSQPRKRVRNPEVHRAAILLAAREVFAEHGYGRATIREIASRAGVAHGLVRLHFTSKEQLFVAALLQDRRHVADTIDGDLDGLAERVVRTFVERIDSNGAGDAFVAIIRSAGDTEVARALLQAMRKEPTAAFAKALDVPDVERRSDMLGALFIGVAFSRHVLADGPLAAMSSERLVASLIAPTRSILFDSAEKPDQP
jgi:AcrR family transcriptional regulator